MGFSPALAAPAAIAPEMADIAVLPSGRSDAALAMVGHHLYVFGGVARVGGASVPLDEILRVDTLDGHVTLMSARLPTPRAYVAAVAVEGGVLLFGGCPAAGSCTNGILHDDILRYDPVNDRILFLGELPSPRAAAAAIYTGRAAYVFGGDTCDAPPTCPTSEIVRFDTRTGAVDVLPQRLPVRLAYASAVNFGPRAYLFGGLATPDGPGTGHAVPTSAIYRFDTLAHAVDTLTWRLPTPRYATSAAVAGGSAYVFGGADGPLDSVIRFDLAAERTASANTHLPTPRAATAATSDGIRAYILGGAQGATRLDDVLALRPGVPP